MYIHMHYVEIQVSSGGSSACTITFAISSPGRHTVGRITSESIPVFKIKELDAVEETEEEDMLGFGIAMHAS